MKKLLVLFFLFFSCVGFSQEIKLNTIDGFTNDRTIETSIVTLKQGLSNGFGASFTAVNKVYYLNIVGYGTKQRLISDEDRIWFILDDGSVVKFNSRVALPYNETEYPNIYIHHYYVNLQDVEAMTSNRVTLIRIVNSEGSLDIPLSKKSMKTFAKLNDVFLKEVSK